MPKFSLGIEMKVEADGGVTIQRVMPGSAAERDGLKEGDVLLAANGEKVGDPAVLRPFLDSGRAIHFEIDRAGKRTSVSVQPNPRR